MDIYHLIEYVLRKWITQLNKFQIQYLKNIKSTFIKNGKNYLWNGQHWYHQRISFSLILMILNAHTCLSSLKYKLKLISTVEVCRCSSFTTTVTNVFGTKGNGLGLVCRGVNYQNKVISSSSDLLRGGHVHDFHKI